MFETLWDVFWVMVWFFLMFIWIWLLISIIGDIFARKMSGVKKALWVVVLIIFPLLGALFYLIANGSDMQVRGVQRAREFEDAQAEYIRSVAGSSTADELAKLAQLRDSGALTADEFAAQKAKLLG